MIKLVSDTISSMDIDRLREWLSKYPRLTMGEETKKFEEEWSEWLGRKYSVFVNSGSSANLVMIYALKYQFGVKKMAVPALSWSTDLAPLIQFGIEPVLIDCNMKDLSMDLDHLEEVLEADVDVDSVLFVSVLGLVPDMLRVKRLCDKHGVYLIEDNCESMGSKRGQVKLGTHGLMSTHSLYFGHHISTIEGGLISTDHKDLYDLLLMLRSHGWARDVDIDTRKVLRNLWSVDEFLELYTFYVPGFNVRSTDLQAFLGRLQMKKLDEVCRRRFDNFALYRDILSGAGMWVPEVTWIDWVSNFAYPVISSEREWIVKRLKENMVETRPLIAGSMGDQPFYKRIYGKKYLANAHKVDQQGFYVPNHANLTATEIKRVCRLITTY